MKTFIRFTVVAVPMLMMAACQPTDGTNQNPSTGTGGVLINAAAEGEFCGGIAGILCADGLECKYDGQYPDAGGTCQKL